MDWQQGLVRVPNAHPSRRMDLQLGTSPGRPVWWSLDDGRLRLCVGEDVESWDFVVTVPATSLGEIQAEVAEAAIE